MQTYHQIVEALKHSPQLPVAIQELNSFWQAEQVRRVQFYNDIDEDSKAEFIEGEIVVHSPAKDRHNEVVVNLSMLLHAFTNKYNLGIVRSEKALIKLKRNDFEPDLCFWANEKAEFIEGETLFYPAPDWVCEVLSASTARFDRGIKMKDYALNGIGEYWIIDAEEQVVEQYILADDQYELKMKAATGILQSTEIKDFHISVTAIFDRKENLAALTSLLSQ